MWQVVTSFYTIGHHFFLSTFIIYFYISDITSKYNKLLLI